MKIQVIIICIILCVPSIRLNAQMVIKENKTWSQINFILPSMTAITEHLKTTGDTLISGKNYKKVYKSTDKEQTNWISYMLIRETTEGFIYFKTDTTQGEYLFYRSDAFIGDTISLSSITSSNGKKQIQTYPFRIEGRDSVSINGTYLERTSLRWIAAPVGLNTYFIERIGSVSGLVHWSTGLLGGDSYKLICCSEDGFFIFHETQYPNCFYEWNKAEETGISHDLIHVVSKKRNTLYIVLQNGTKGQFCIYNVLGEQLLTEKLEGADAIISLTTGGIFFYRFINCDGAIQTGKVLVR